jgi:outer membrane protein assembly factor BamA
VAPTLGDLQFNSVTGDFRKYFLMRPLTLAFRAMHFGRYGRDEAVPSPVFLGYPFLVRGYGYNSVQNDCLAELQSGTNGKDCIIFQDLFGSRVAIGNLELRLPLINNPVRGSVQVPPVEVFGFLDTGAAWGKLQATDSTVVATHLNFRRGVGSDLSQRGFLSSGGVGARMNLFGYIIVEADYVNAFDRPTKWHWQFSFQPGF